MSVCWGSDAHREAYERRQARIDALTCGQRMTDYAELQKPPKPDYDSYDYGFAVLAGILGIATLWAVYEVFVA